MLGLGPCFRVGVSEYVHVHDLLDLLGYTANLRCALLSDGLCTQTQLADSTVY